jgi:hypothetical protein
VTQISPAGLPVLPVFNDNGLVDCFVTIVVFGQVWVDES